MVPEMATEIIAGTGDTTPAETIAERNDTISILRDYLSQAGKQIIYFEFASDRTGVDPKTADIIEKASYLLKNTEQEKILITGHSDSRGTPEGNLKFSRQRAEFVKNLFVARGVDPSRLVTEAKSDQQPAASNETEDGRRMNRRAEFQLLK
jgi:outer membrane protein OmpA-like peptidoglycan-associated protein